ncbi:hypothetical protein [Microbispora siamensis]|uniref:Uncharacterized protein n=1 Tax=Microbispora siamensis TaxID=564413 RepID=A0ABQ4GZW5_9ACTN|nr:hypothetical protein [Microbispora siamensis]GIH66986.1 hypothetical protein Msi02_78030 [Microbispora siamensis]
MAEPPMPPIEGRLRHWAEEFAARRDLPVADLRIDPPLHREEAEGLVLALRSGLVMVERAGVFRLAGAHAAKGPYNLFSTGPRPMLNREYLIQIATFAELVVHHRWPARQVVFEYDAFDLGVLDEGDRPAILVETKRDEAGLDVMLSRVTAAREDEVLQPRTADQRKASALVRLRPRRFLAVAPGVRRCFGSVVEDGRVRLIPRSEIPHGTRGDRDCPVCGGEDVTGSRLPDGRIALLCGGCHYRWSRTPRHPCPRCGSGDVEENGYRGWAFEDEEEARDNPDADWHYVDWRVFRCSRCHNEWREGSRAG